MEIWARHRRPYLHMNLHFWIPENLNINLLFKMKLFLLFLPVSLFSFCIIGCGAPEDEGPEEAPAGTEESLAEETAVEE